MDDNFLLLNDIEKRTYLLLNAFSTKWFVAKKKQIRIVKKMKKPTEFPRLRKRDRYVYLGRSKFLLSSHE